MNFLLTPSQRIIKSIQKTITKLNSEKELDTIKELEWVIQKLNKKDLFDFSLKNEVRDITDLKENEILNFLSEYSSENDTSIKFNDINTCNIIEQHKKEKSSSKLILEKVSINTNQHQKLLEKLDKEDFNIFEFEKEVTSDMVLPLIGMQILSLDQFLTCLDSTKLDAFLLNVKMGYLKNPYHNANHAADVLQTGYVFFLKGKLSELIGLSSLENLAFLISSLMHDLYHPGQNNAYQINSISKHALRYNGNHHSV